MYLKKFLAQPNVVGTVLIAFLVGTGFVYAFAFDGFNVQTATDGDVDAWVAMASSGNCGGGDDELTCKRVRKKQGPNKKKCKLSNGKWCEKNCLRKPGRCGVKGCA